MEREAGTYQGGKKEKNHFGEISESVNCRLSRTEFLLPQVFFFLRFFFFFFTFGAVRGSRQSGEEGTKVSCGPPAPPHPRHTRSLPRDRCLPPERHAHHRR